MGAGRKERLYLCLGFLAAEDFAWVVFREWLMYVCVCTASVLSVHVTGFHSVVLFQFSLPDRPLRVCFRG